MNADDLKNKTTEQLQSSLQMIKATTGVLAVVLVLLLTITIYGLLNKEDNATFIALLAVAISSCGMLPLLYVSIKRIKTELQLRENANE